MKWQLNEHLTQTKEILMIENPYQVNVILQLMIRKSMEEKNTNNTDNHFNGKINRQADLSLYLSIRMDL